MTRPPLDCELSLSSPGGAQGVDPGGEALGCPLRLSCGQDTYGEAFFDAATLARLAALADDPEAYGGTLFRLLFPSGSRQERGFREIQSKARAQRRRLRLRLHLLANLPTTLHVLEWERLFDPETRRFLACSQETPFSRFCTVPLDPGEPTRGKVRLLGVISTPRDAKGRIPEFTPTQIETVRSSLAALGAWIEVDILDSPATPERLRDALGQRTYHALLFFGHGLIHRTPARELRDGGPRQRASLVFEEDDGSPRFLDESRLAQGLADHRELRLVALIACHGGAPSSQQDNFSGVAGRLVEQGCPAVLGLCRAVSIDAGLLFTEHLFRTLAATGRVDVAVNEARHQLYLEDSLATAWSSPRLFMRLEDGRLWSAPSRDRWRIPAAAGLALMALLATLAGGRTEETEVELDLHTRGLGFVLDRDHEVIDRWPLEELAASHLGQIDTPKALGGRRFRSQDIPRGPLGLVVRTLPDPTPTSPETTSSRGSSLTLQGLRLPAATFVFLEQIERSDGPEYQLLLRGFQSRLWLDMVGSVWLKLLHQPATTLTSPVPQAIHLSSEADEIFLDLRLALDTARPAEAAGNRGRTNVDPRGFVAGIPIRHLELTTDQIIHRPEGSLAKEIDLVESCRIHFPSTGTRYALSRGERLRWDSLRGTLQALKADEEGLRFQLRGRVTQLSVTGADAESLPRSLMPSLLATSLGHRHAAPIVGTVLGLVSLGVLGPWLARRPEVFSIRQRPKRLVRFL